MKLTINELTFIVRACRLSDGVYDFQMDDKDFKELYGHTPSMASRIVQRLELKASREEARRKNMKIAKQTPIK